MDYRVPVDKETSHAWVVVAQGARVANRVLDRLGEPLPNSLFTQVNAIYPHEKASDWNHAYLEAALEHLMVWADIAAPLKFHPEQEVTHAFRPAYTLARAAMEAASQAVWMTGGETAKECARRHLCLMRWDYEEHRKSLSDNKEKRRIEEVDESLLRLASDVFSEEELRPPNYYTVLRAAAAVIGLKPDHVERVWRAASGSAHGKVWPSLALQHVVPLSEYEPGHLRALRVPDPGKMTEVLELAKKMTMHGVLRHADFLKADISALLEEATQWLASVVPLREDADPEVIARLRRRETEN